MLVFFLGGGRCGGGKGLVDYEFISECKTVNKEMYFDILHHLWMPSEGNSLKNGE
jgi:hypothetical protein